MQEQILAERVDHLEKLKPDVFSELAVGLYGGTQESARKAIEQASAFFGGVASRSR